MGRAAHVSNAEWKRIEALLPHRKAHPYGAHNPRISDRDAMEAVLLFFEGEHTWEHVGRISGLSKSSVYRRYREWADAGVFERMAAMGLIQTEGLSQRRIP